MANLSENRENAQKILDAAVTLWGEKGYSASTMRELARRVGMGVSSLYFYFRSKEEIVQFLYRQVNEQARSKFGAEPRASNLAADLQRFLQIKLALLEPHRSSLSAILREAVDPASALSPLSPDSAAVLDDNVGFFREMVRTHQAAAGGRELPVAQLIWLAHLAVVLFWMHDRSPGFRNTRVVIEKLSAGVTLLPMLDTLPGAAELMGIMGEMLAGREGEEAKVADGAAAGEPAAPARQCDVVVIGGGPIGVLYATFLKKQRPATNIVVLEKSAEPGHKIGESTLSGFCKALRTVGIRHDVQERLFYPKNGLGFFHVDESVHELTAAPEYILETFDQTFQVERRVLDSLVIANARKLGVQVIQGAHVDIKASSIGAKGSTVVYQVGPGQFRLACSLVVDASGPSSLISHERATRTDEDVAFQTSSAWTYYAGIKPLASYTGFRALAMFPRDQYTEHFCFREGWMWYIPLVSWQKTPISTLQAVIGQLLDKSPAPSRQELIASHSAPVVDITSIGITLRQDRDTRMADDPRAAFEHIAKKYPVVKQVLAGAKVLDDWYGPSTTFMSRLRFRGHAKHACGDGWLLVGDAAFFVDPLISPGLTGGTAGAFHAAQISATALDSGDFTARALSPYDRAVQGLQQALERDNEIVYMSFNHPEALALIQRWQEVDSRRHFMQHKAADYSLADTNVWGILDPQYQRTQGEVWALMREEEARVGKEVPVEEQSTRDYARMVERLRKLLGFYLTENEDLTPFAKANAG